MTKSGCLKCPSVSAKKEGPPFKETAAKYKGKADAEAALFKHLTTNPKIKVDGKEELHDNLKTKNEAEGQNVVKVPPARQGPGPDPPKLAATPRALCHLFA